VSGGIFLERGDELIAMREQAYDSENVLQTLLERFPTLLAGNQFASEPLRWLLVRREAGVPAASGGGDRWSLDHLFVDDVGIPTMVEVKRSSDSRIRREVVGQMLDYAANGIVYWPDGRLRSDFEERCRRGGQDPDQVFASALGEEADQDEFWPNVDQNLRDGRVRLVFVSDAIPPELRRVIEFLNERMTPTEVIGIEVKQYVGGDGVRTLVPRVIGQTEEARLVHKAQPRQFAALTWDGYAQILSEDRFNLAQTLFQQIEAAVAARGLQWVPVLRRGYFAFQRRGGYGVVGVDLYREKPVELWVKLPGSPDELRGLGQTVDDPYPNLSAAWDAHNKQWEWQIPAISSVPEVGLAIDLTTQYQPDEGPMRLPARSP
jgi:hypothetical protein